jgi:methylisocitrate lyase
VRHEKRTTFRELVAKEQIFAPCIWDVFSARAAEATGYKAMLLSGGALGYSMIGVPDIGLLNAEELVQATSRIADASTLPMVVDADDGYSETAIGVYRTCRRLARAGAMGITLDDTTGVRGYERWGADFRAGVAAGKVDGNIPHPMVSRELWLSKVKAALDAVSDTDCVVIARTEAKLGMGFDEAIERTVLARELGAEMTLIIGLKSLDECRRVAKADKGPKMYPDVASVKGVPDVELADIEPLGFNFVTMHYLEKAAIHGMLEYGKHVIKDRNTVYADDHDLDGMTNDDIRNAEHGEQNWLDWEREWKKV